MFSWGYYSLGEDTLAGCPVAEWGAGPIAGQYARFMEVNGVAFGVSPRQSQGLVWECHSCSAPPFPRPGGGGSGNTQTVPFCLHFGSPACTHSQLSVSV